MTVFRCHSNYMIFAFPVFFVFLSNLIANQSIDITIFDLKLRFWIFWHLFLSSGPTSVWSWQKKKFDNPVAILWENWVASIGSIWRGFGWDSSQTEVLQSPWISKKWPKHLLIFPSAQYNHIVGGMMKKREAQKIEKTKNQIGFEILWFRRRARKLNKFYPRLTFYTSNHFFPHRKIFGWLNLAWGYLALWNRFVLAPWDCLKVFWNRS